MKLKDLDDLLIFDVFPLVFNPHNKIILTHLLHMEKQPLPQKLPMIYTTNNIAEQLLSYADAKNCESITRSNITTIEPYSYFDIVINNYTLQLLFCPSKDESQNLMVLIRMNEQLISIYAGIFTDIRSALLDDIFASWISNGVKKLYINLKRTDEDHIFNDIDQMQKVFNKIDEILKCHIGSKVHIYLPLFGYANFIFKLAQKFPNRIALQSTLETFYLENQINDSDTLKHFCDENIAKIFLFSGNSTSIQAHFKFNNSKLLTINILNDRTKCVDNAIVLHNPYYELYYSPEPSPFHLKLLCMLVKPNRIYGIVDEFTHRCKIPDYLKELCVGTKEKHQQNQLRKSNTNLSASTSSQIHELPKNILVGATTTKIKQNIGPYLEDSESDSD